MCTRRGSCDTVASFRGLELRGAACAASLPTTIFPRRHPRADDEAGQRGGVTTPTPEWDCARCYRRVTLGRHHPLLTPSVRGPRECPDSCEKSSSSTAYAPRSASARPTASTPRPAPTTW